ncbi:hypothetical protein [Rhizobium lusitanum]|uniref:hypothetical protein n=1 Tax=Rhizobium lusitanum TaxID=293958 RepID=UPI001958F8ED|nr:hypothetical protein [Rhizobium lusitanum]MBM7046436.1 hypothetical protein [Rhizobium lusitanum]
MADGQQRRVNARSQELLNAGMPLMDDRAAKPFIKNSRIPRSTGRDVDAQPIHPIDRHVSKLLASYKDEAAEQRDLGDMETID